MQKRESWKVDERIKTAMIEGVMLATREVSAKWVRNATGYGGGSEEAGTLEREFIRLNRAVEMALKVIEELPE